MTRKAEIYHGLAKILATTNQSSTAVIVFDIMRKLNPRGHLFLTNPVVLAKLGRPTIALADIRDQVFRDLDRGLAYSKIALNLHVDHRKVRTLRDDWARLPESSRQRYRNDWGEERRQRRDVLEDARDEANSRYVASLRPRLRDDDEHQDIHKHNG